MHLLKFLSGTTVLLATKGLSLEQSNEEIREVSGDRILVLKIIGKFCNLLISLLLGISSSNKSRFTGEVW